MNSPTSSNRSGSKKPLRKAPYPRPPGLHSDANGFDVTCVIGSVQFDPDGPVDPTAAAFLLIGEHDAPGVYSFPRPDGTLCRVIVEHE